MVRPKQETGVILSAYRVIKLHFLSLLLVSGLIQPLLNMLDSTCHLVYNSNYFNHVMHVCVDVGEGWRERDRITGLLKSCGFRYI